MKRVGSSVAQDTDSRVGAQHAVYHRRHQQDTTPASSRTPHQKRPAMFGPQASNSTSPLKPATCTPREVSSSTKHLGASKPPRQLTKETTKGRAAVLSGVLRASGRRDANIGADGVAGEGRQNGRGSAYIHVDKRSGETTKGAAFTKMERELSVGVPQLSKSEACHLTV